MERVYQARLGLVLGLAALSTELILRFALNFPLANSALLWVFLSTRFPYLFVPFTTLGIGFFILNLSPMYPAALSIHALALTAATFLATRKNPAIPLAFIPGLLWVFCFLPFYCRANPFAAMGIGESDLMLQAQFEIFLAIVADAAALLLFHLHRGDAHSLPNLISRSVTSLVLAVTCLLGGLLFHLDPFTTGGALLLISPIILPLFFAELLYPAEEQVAQKVSLPEPKTFPKPMQILIVEGEPLLQTVIPNMLKALGYQAEVCTTNSEALLLCQKKEFDLILVDATLSNGNGVGFVKTVRQKRPTQRALLVGGIQPSIAASEEHCQVLPKPFDIPTLSAAITLAVEKGISQELCVEPARSPQLRVAADLSWRRLH